MANIRKAVTSDGKIISELIAPYAEKAIMLKRPESEVFSTLRDFVIFENDEGEVCGISALHIYDKDLGEIRSLAVKDGHIKEGVGTKLVEDNIREARELGIRRIFVLTYVKDFFTRLGFKEIPKEQLPQKVWRDCISCLKFPHCDETAMYLDIKN